MGTLWTREIKGKNAHVYVYVYGYKVRLHVYKNCVNVAALILGSWLSKVANFYLRYVCVMQDSFQVNVCVDKCAVT